MAGRRAVRDGGRRGGPGGEAGQAQVELVVAIPVLLVAGLVAAQLLCFGYAQTRVDGAAEAAAIAAPDGRDPLSAARAALPGWAADRVEVADDGDGGLRVEVDVPAMLPGLGGRLRATGTAWVRPATGVGWRAPGAAARGAGDA